MKKHDYYWRRDHDHYSNTQLADMLVEKAKAAGADNMGVPDSLLLEAAYRLEVRGD